VPTAIPNARLCTGAKACGSSAAFGRRTPSLISVTDGELARVLFGMKLYQPPGLTRARGDSLMVG
jgi:hypothetical protein